MNTECCSERLFFSLLRSALWGTPVRIDEPVDATVWADLLQLAKRHAVQGILYDAIKELPPDAGMPRGQVAEWLLEVDRIERFNARMRAVIDVQRKVWQRYGIEAILLKGITVAAMYPVPEHRICGDIDWWLPDNDSWQRSVDVVKNNKIAVSFDSDGDAYYELNGVVVEHHHKGLKWPGTVGELLMLNTHILHHAAVTGIGMRHICDLAMGCKYFKGKYADSEYEQALRKLGLLRWTDLLHSTLRRVMDIPEEYLPVLPGARPVPDKDVDKFVRLVMTDGNFGMDRAQRYSGFFLRAGLFLKYAPWAFIGRWLRLIIGRTFR